MLAIKSLLTEKAKTQKEKILLILQENSKKPKEVSEIRAIGRENGLHKIGKWNISQILKSLNSNGQAIKLPEGWEITQAGFRFLVDCELVDNSPTGEQQSVLRLCTQSISSLDSRQLVEECISALEVGLLRAAVVLSWAGAISILYEEILNNHLTDFELELKKRKPKSKQIKTLDDLASLKEYDFLQITSSISVIGKNVRQELEQCLKLRNACAHPNSLSLGEIRVAAHLEVLILNVYQKFV
ncbi:MAG: hypothetical protein ACFB9N_12595 [Geitlerinemataceae cyanobacterium]